MSCAQRVDLVACPIDRGLRAARSLMLAHQVTGICIYRQGLDDILGEIHLRDCLLHPEADLESLLRPVHFVPEQKNVESLLQYFRKMRTDAVIVVDEYGGVAGSVHIEDLAEELVGPLHSHDDSAMIEQLGPLLIDSPAICPSMIGRRPGFTTG